MSKKIMAMEDALKEGVPTTAAASSSGPSDTLYVLAEVWLPGEDGLRVHTIKGAHQTQVVIGQKAK
jgi:hypothetical protein